MSLLHKDCLSNIGQNKHFDSPKLNISMESLRRTRFFATVSVELEDDTVREVSNNFWFIFTASWSFYALYSKTQFLWYGALCSLNIGRRFTWSFSDFFSSVWQPNFSKENSPIFPISGSCWDSKRWLPPVSFPHKASALTSYRENKRLKPSDRDIWKIGAKLSFQVEHIHHAVEYFPKS